MCRDADLSTAPVLCMHHEGNKEELACTSLVMKASTSVGYRVCNGTALQSCAKTFFARDDINVFLLYIISEVV